MNQGKNKGNPVPSLDNTIEWLQQLDVPCVFTQELKQSIIDEINHELELQNGVETNKEYPEEYTVSGKRKILVG